MPRSPHQAGDAKGKSVTRLRAARQHQGVGHWHVEVRSIAIVCRRCEARIPRWQDPAFCPECGDGRES